MQENEGIMVYIFPFFIAPFIFVLKPYTLPLLMFTQKKIVAKQMDFLLLTTIISFWLNFI